MTDSLPGLSEAALSLRPGRYRHYKDASHEYEVLGVARHSETLEEEVVYRSLYGEPRLWVRPIESFLSEVDTPTGVRPRFEFIGEN